MAHGHLWLFNMRMCCGMQISSLIAKLEDCKSMGKNTSCVVSPNNPAASNEDYLFDCLTILRKPNTNNAECGEIFSLQSLFQTVSQGTRPPVSQIRRFIHSPFPPAILKALGICGVLHLNRPLTSLLGNTSSLIFKAGMAYL